MKKENFIRILLVLVSAGCVFVFTGCFGDYYTRGKVKTVQSHSNTFALVPVYKNEKVLAISVIKNVGKGLFPENVWLIEAVESVPVKNFTVTIGKVPEGFEQLNPSPDCTFIPIRGEKYSMHIATDGEWSVFEKEWIAE